jgi:hypothetical protein
MEGAIPEFRKVINRVVHAVASGEFKLADYSDEREPGDEISKILDGIEDRPSLSKPS